MTSTHVLDLPGLRLYYEVRGEGPLLLLVGAPMPSGPFAPLADLLATDFTVVTHDPRGISNSKLDDPELDSTPDLRADDVAALLDHLGADNADILGSSGGAVTGLALVARHPHRVRTLIAHEPPLLELLPDVEAQRAMVDDIVDTFHRDGLGPAWLKFMRCVGFDIARDHGAPAADPVELSEQDIRDSTRFFAYEMRGTTRYQPDIAALTAAPGTVLIGLGADSGHLLTYRTSMAIAEALGTQPVEFPGGHDGFAWQPDEFAKTLRTVLAA